MFSLSNLRFQKYDTYNQLVFIASKDDEKENYGVLKRLYNKLQAKEVETFLPIYENEKYSHSSIRFRASDTFKDLDKNNLYDVEFEIRQNINKQGKMYFYCELKECKHVGQREDTSKLVELV